MRDPLFAHSVRLTVLYTLLFVPISIVLSLLCAVALNRKLWFIRLYRTAIFLPVVASTVAEAILFLWLFDPYNGDRQRRPEQGRDPLSRASSRTPRRLSTASSP